MYVFIYKLCTRNTVAIHYANEQRYTHWNFRRMKVKKKRDVPVFFSSTPSDCLVPVGGTVCHVSVQTVAALVCEHRGKETTLTLPAESQRLTLWRLWSAEPWLPAAWTGSLTHPDAVHDGSGFALCRLWVSNEVIPGAEHPPAERVVFIGRAGEAHAGILSHPAKKDQRKP